MKPFAEPSFSQVTSPLQSGAMPPQYSQLEFNQDLNIYNWIYTLKYQKLLSNGLTVNLSEQYQSTLQSISFQDRWKDTQDFALLLTYPVTSSLTVKSEFQSHILSDPLAGFDNDVTFYSGAAGIIYQPTRNMLLAPTVSSKWQTQVEQNDQGFGFGLDARLFNLEFDGYHSDLSLLAERDFFPERTNEDFRLRYEVNRQFHESTADTLRIFFDRYRRDSFDVDQSGIFVRNLSQTNRGLENRLRYRIARDASVLVRNALSSSTFRVRNFKSSELDIRKDDAGFESRNSVQFELQKTRWFGNVNWSFRTRSRDDRRPQDSVRDPFGTRHPSLGFDTDETFTKLDLRTGFKVSESDSLGLFASASRFQFDTSDTTNSNDHDQLQWQVTFSHSHLFGQTLRLVWQGSVFLKHFVYISGQFSGGNNWERVFQLNPQLVYQPSERFLFRQGFTVRAKYQTYDFDDPETSNRNIVNRQFVLGNVTRYSFSDATALEFGMNLELAEQGKLFYDLWRQRLALSWQNQELRLALRHRIDRKFLLKPGVHLFRQIRWNHKVTPDGTLRKTVRDIHTSLGPILEILYRPGRAVEFEFFGNVQWINSSGRPTEHLNFDVNLNWFF